MKESFLIQGGLIVTCDEKGTIIPDGFIRIKGEKIAEIGSGTPAETSDQTIDASRCVMIPGLVTAHTHLYGILLRGANLNIEPPLNFVQILQRVWWPVDEALTLEDAKASALSASADMLRNGSTFFADTYSGPNSIEGSLDAIAEATRKVGIRAMLAFEMTERNEAGEAKRGLKENIRFAKKCEKDPLTSALMSIHASFTVGDKIVTKAAATAKDLGIPITVHTSEGQVDLQYNLEKYGERTVERLDRVGLLGPRTVLAHCVHVDEHELDLIAASGSSVAHNPMSNMLNAVGTAPIPKMLERGIPVGLGNDGWIYDPFENMRCALTVHRLATGNPSIIGAEEILKMATLDGAKCYGLEHRIGSIEVGKLADIVLLNTTRVPTPLTPDSVVGHLVNTFGGRDVRCVFVHGEKVVDDSRLVKISDEEVSKVSSESAKRLWSRLK